MYFYCMVLPSLRCPVSIMMLTANVLQQPPRLSLISWTYRVHTDGLFRWLLKASDCTGFYTEIFSRVVKNKHIAPFQIIICKTYWKPCIFRPYIYIYIKTKSGKIQGVQIFLKDRHICGTFSFLESYVKYYKALQTSSLQTILLMSSLQIC